MKQYQAQLEESKALAVMNPTPQNVFNYQRMQYEMTEKAGKFAEVWMQNVYKNPSIDYTQKSPVSQNARHIYLAEQRKQTDYFSFLRMIVLTATRLHPWSRVSAKNTIGMF